MLYVFFVYFGAFVHFCN